MVITETSHAISIKKFRSLVNRYRKHRLRFTLPEVPNGQTKWVWFSKKEIEEVLKFVEKSYPHLGDEDKGIKFYFGMYGEESDPHPDLPADHKDRMTLAMVPAFHHGALDACVDYGSALDETNRSAESSEDLNIPTSYIYNVGSMCPPKCSDDGDLI